MLALTVADDQAPIPYMHAESTISLLCISSYMTVHVKTNSHSTFRQVQHPARIFINAVLIHMCSNVGVDNTLQANAVQTIALWVT